MRAPIIRLAGPLLVVVLTACGPFAAAPRADREIVTQRQMEARHFLTVYDAITALHSNWLIERPLSFRSNPIVLVYMDDVRLGGVDELRYVMVDQVSYVQHYDAPAATTRFGVGHPQGAIVVSTHPL